MACFCLTKHLYVTMILTILVLSILEEEETKHEPDEAKQDPEGKLIFVTEGNISYKETFYTPASIFILVVVSSLIV